MEVSANLFEGVMNWLRNNYRNYHFFTERDIVWLVQTSMLKIIETKKLRYRVRNDYSIVHLGLRRSSIDLVILDDSDNIVVAIEFSYEPSHRRDDILPENLPMVTYDKNGVGREIECVKEYVQRGAAKIAYAVLIDENSLFRKRNPFPGSEWRDWEPLNKDAKPVAILWAKVVAEEKQA